MLKTCVSVIIVWQYWRNKWWLQLGIFSIRKLIASWLWHQSVRWIRLSFMFVVNCYHLLYFRTLLLNWDFEFVYPLKLWMMVVEYCMYVIQFIVVNALVLLNRFIKVDLYQVWSWSFRWGVFAWLKMMCKNNREKCWIFWLVEWFVGCCFVLYFLK